jgi:hypothetical protein
MLITEKCPYIADIIVHLRPLPYSLFSSTQLESLLIILSIRNELSKEQSKELSRRNCLALLLAQRLAVLMM